MYILLVGFNHKTAPLAVRERFACSEKRRQALYSGFRASAGLESLLILSTCNRTELYAVATEATSGIAALSALFAQHTGQTSAQIQPFLYSKTEAEAVQHLYEVAAGLDSMILGETQILGQLKQAYEEARTYHSSGRILNQLLQKAFAVGKKVRTLTAIDQHPVSVSYVAVEQARLHSGGLNGKKVLVVGAGEAGQLAARYLQDEGVKAIFISNRSAATAQKLAAQLHGEAVCFAKMPEYLSEVDVVISCTGAAHMVIHDEASRQALLRRAGRPILLIDIAVPRDINPEFRQIPGVCLYDMDNLEQVIARHQQQRQQAAQQGQAVIAQEMLRFQAWKADFQVIPTITALKKHGAAVRQRELERAFNRLGRNRLSAHEQQVLEQMAQAMVNQLLRPLVENLKDWAENQPNPAELADFCCLLTPPEPPTLSKGGEV